MAKKLLLIVNPCAGKKKIAGVLNDVLCVFCAKGYLPTVLMTEYSGHARVLTEKYASQYDLVVCAGGDGTLNETVSGIRNAGLEIPIGYLPCGTTNDLAATLGLSSDPVKAAQDVCTGSPMPIDIGDFNGRSFVYTASFGAFTNTSYETPQNVKNALGHLAYLLEGVKSVTQLKPIHARVETDAGVFEGEYLFGSVSNTTSLAGIITLDRELVMLDDGSFELLLVDTPKSIQDFGKLLLQLTQKRFDDMLHLYEVKTCHIVTQEDLDWTLDGEHETGKRVFDIVNNPRAVRIVTPSDT